MTLDMVPRPVVAYEQGGTVESVPGVKVTAVRAEHSSTFIWRDFVTGRDEVPAPGEVWVF